MNVPDPWSVKSLDEEGLWERAVLESAQMEVFDQTMDEDQPLDLSVKVKVMTPAASRPPAPEGKHHGQETPLCLIKDCGCTNHGPRPRITGSTAIYDCGKYGPPVKDGAFSRVEPLEVRSERFESSRPCFEHCIQGRTSAIERNWESRRAPNVEERMESDHLGCRYDRLSPAVDRSFRVPYRTSVSADLDKHTHHFPTSQAFYDSRDNNPQCFVDLSISNRACPWRPPHPHSHLHPHPHPHPQHNEDKFKGSWSGDLTRHINRPGSWSHAETSHLHPHPHQHPHPHWRPFVDSGGGGLHGPDGTKSRGPDGSKPSSLPLDRSSSPKTASSKSMWQSFASTVPLIPNSSKKETSHSSSSTKSNAPMMVPRGPYTSIRVTRSPKTFHNQLPRSTVDADARTCPFKRPQDANKGRGLAGKLGLQQEKENIDTSDAKTPSEGVKMPALDYLISKVLVERIDIPFKACNTEIKKIYNGESKGRLRLVDLIELQVEESLKA